MVERIFLFKLNEPDSRHEVAALTQAALADLGDVEELSVGTPADPNSEKSWDLSVVLGVVNLTLLDTLLESAPVVRWYQDMSARSAVVKAWSFDRLG